MASTPSTSLRLELMGQGDKSNLWGDVTNQNLTILEAAATGVAEVAVSAATTTLAAADYTLATWHNRVLKFTGALTANATVVVPAYAKVWTLWNATTGNYSLTVKTASGTGVTIPQGGIVEAFCDGANVVVATPATTPSGIYTPAGGTVLATSNANIAFRNKLHNGRMRVAQRGSGPWTASGIGLDRWYGFVIPSVLRAQIVADPSSTARNYFELRTVQTKTSLAAADLGSFSQVIEGYDIADLEWGTANAKPVTVRFLFATSVAGTYTAALRSGDIAQSCVKTFPAVSGVNTITLTFPGPTSGTWTLSNGPGLSFFVVAAAGNGYHAPATDSWVSGDKLSVPGTVNLAATLNAYARLTDVTLVEGAEPLPMSACELPYAQELLRCMRYYQDVAFINASAGPYYQCVKFHVPMRATPTLKLVGGSLAGSVLEQRDNTYFDTAGRGTAENAVIVNASAEL